MQDVEKAIKENFEIDIKSICNYKDMYIITAQQGEKKLAKLSNLKADRISFIAEVKEHLIRNGFTNIDRNIPAIQGGFSANIGELCLYITDYIEGRELNLESNIETSASASMLASMHKASYGFRISESISARSELGKLPLCLQKRLDEIKKLRKAAQKGRMKFDHMICESTDYFLKTGELALDLLADSEYIILSDKAAQDGVISHHDFNHHNIYVNDDAMYVVNFEYCCFDLKVYDLVNLLRRKMRKCNWDIKEAVNIIEEYSKIETISKEELEIMKIMLLFPQKFWMVINKYYNSKRSWSEKSFVTRLQEVIDEVEPHSKFMSEFIKL